METNKRVFMTVKIHEVFKTLENLEASLKNSRALEALRSLHYSALKIEKAAMIDDLKKANKRNKNMLNLFRQSVTDVRLGSTDALPESLKREVQRIWHQKYDTLLAQNEQLKKEVEKANVIAEERRKEIDVLEQRLLNLSENLIEREKAIKNVCTKYLNLKKCKDEQEILLRESIESLQNTLREANDSTSTTKSDASLSKAAMLLREIRRSDRLAYENAVLRKHLFEARRECKSYRSSDAASLQK